MATSTISSVLKDVVAYVDVWSSDKTANYSDPFIQQLQDMGAEVTKTFNKRVTHVVFNYGHPATWKKAKKGNVRLVSVLWVGRCHDEATKVDEDLFPALNDPFPNKKHRCMQPKDSPEKTPDTDKRMRKKLDKMMKDLTPQKPLVKDFSPVIIDEENGIIYSPGLKRSEYMAQRLKDMKEKRENISPTASQLVESPSELKPSLGNSPTVFKFPYDQSDDDSSPSVAETGLSPAKEEGTLLPDVKGRCYEHLIKDGTEKSCSEAFEKQLSTPVKCTIFEGNEDIEENKQSTSRRASRRTSVKRNSTDSNIPIPLSETTEPVTSARKNISKKDRRSSAVKSLKLFSSRKNDNKDGKETTKEEKSETKTQRNVKSSVAAADDVSVKTTSPILEKEQPLSEQVPILSAQATTLPNDSHKTVLCPTDADAFEDYFSTVNLQQKPKMPLTSGLVRKTFQLPFELNSDAKKTKPRRKSAVSEMTKGSKKVKLEKSAINLKDLDTGNPPERHVAKDNKMLLSDPCNPCYTALELHKVSVSSQSSVQSCSSTSRGNEDSDESGFIETVSEEQNKEASGLLKMVHKTKVGRTLVMTSMPTEKQNTVCQVVKALGGFTVVDEVCESTTHVVSDGHRRTLNILLGIARGCWILSFEWILWSLEKRQWIPEEPYELSEQFPAAQVCKTDIHTHSQCVKAKCKCSS